MKKISQIRQSIKDTKKVTIGIAGITEEEISIVKLACKENLANFVLVDNEVKIKELLKSEDMEKLDVEIFHVEDVHQAPLEIMKLIKENKVDLPMKGQVHTSVFLKAILNEEYGLKDGSRLSQVTMFDGYNGTPQFLSDCAINIDQSIDTKISIIENSVKIFKYFSNETPKIALLGPVETVSEKMPESIVSSIITQMNRRGQIKNCIIDGPLSLDNAISKKFSQMKKIDSPVAGTADILVASSLAEANSLSKGIIHYGKIDACSIIAGTKIPIVMTSRTDLIDNKLNTIAVACYMMNKLK